jgi:hypothetical protein
MIFHWQQIFFPLVGLTHETTKINSNCPCFPG